MANAATKPNGKHADEATKDELLQYYKDMLLIRRFEERAGQLYGMGLIGGFCHLYIGQEAVVVGMQAALKDGDQVITAYRDHGHMLAAGMTANGVMAELTGRSGGYSKGKGGSMHMFSREKNFYGGHGIVGASTGIGTGLGFSHKYKNDGGIAVAYMGDGASNQGTGAEPGIVRNVATLARATPVDCHVGRHGQPRRTWQIGEARQLLGDTQKAAWIAPQRHVGGADPGVARLIAEDDEGQLLRRRVWQPERCPRDAELGAPAVRQTRRHRLKIKVGREVLFGIVLVPDAIGEHATGIDPKELRKFPRTGGVDPDDQIVLIAKHLVAADERRVDVRRVGVVGPNADVQRIVVIQHAHFGAVACRLLFARHVLDEVGRDWRALPVGLVEFAVQFDLFGGGDCLQRQCRVGSQQSNDGNSHSAPPGAGTGLIFHCDRTG